MTVGKVAHEGRALIFLNSPLRCQRSLSRSPEEHAYRRYRTKEARLSLSAKTQPDLVILAVNTFVRDMDDQNPLVRALAICTMVCIRVEKIIDYLAGTLQKCLHDENPYVRKTAAICVAKLYDLKPDLMLENGFLEQLCEMISNSNPMVRLFSSYRVRVRGLMHPKVVANTISALSDIHIAATSQPSTSSSDHAIFTVTPTILN